jgi:hypothetical protein
MSWFQRSRKEALPAVAQAEAEPELHRSLALPALLHVMRRRGQGLRILDLGPAVGSNVEFLSQLGCKLQIGDLFASRASAGEGEELGQEFFEQLFPGDARFDVVLAWDLFNYLQRREMIRLGSLLRRHCRSGALVFALMAIQKQIPAQPMRFRMQDNGQLLYERRTFLDRPGPRYAPSEISGFMKGFQVDRSFLLRHGIQEYLFLRDDETEDTRVL